MQQNRMLNKTFSKYSSRSNADSFNSHQTSGEILPSDSSHQNSSLTHLGEPLDQLNAMEKSLTDQVHFR